jgi:hypothetical protein
MPKIGLLALPWVVVVGRLAFCQNGSSELKQYRKAS